ncbi:MAG: hypothetical protein IJN83_04730, partial [Clostridia bacterium]|nr:hypothetical protein [Clostridia bacterium]
MSTFINPNAFHYNAVWGNDSILSHTSSHYSIVDNILIKYSKKLSLLLAVYKGSVYGDGYYHAA